MSATVLHGDCRDKLPTIADGSISAIVTDPPYELGFMGKKWDSTGIAYDINVWRECLRVLKPGGHLLAFGGTRTYHRMACAIEDAGFEIRDSIHWLYGSGFPKSLDVSKAIDKVAGVERERTKQQRRKSPSVSIAANGFGADGWAPQVKVPITPAAAAAAGWGTALKPAHEPLVLARKPITTTVAANVLEHGTGALNIDGCRVGTAVVQINTYGERGPFGASQVGNEYVSREASGRWPANVTLDELVAEQHPEWSHYFYVAKPSRSERDAGLGALPTRLGGSLEGGNDKRKGDKPQLSPRQNHHPTVKPIALMRWLVRLITPHGGTVLDPFLGSGTTAVAAILEGFPVIGIEMTDDYLPIIEHRIAWATEQAAQPTQLRLGA